MSDWPLRICVYAGGDSIVGAAGLSKFVYGQLRNLAQVVSNRNVVAFSYIDTDAGAQRLVLDPAGRYATEALPPANVGDPANLLSYVDWCLAKCNALRTVLVLSGHGLAWQDDALTKALGTRTPGMSPMRHTRRLFAPAFRPLQVAVRALLPDGTDHDYLSNIELGAVTQAVSQRLGSKVDVLVLDACLMCSWEVLNELHPAVSTVVGSLDELSSNGIDLTEAARELSSRDQSLKAVELAATIARKYKPQTSFDTCAAVNIDAIEWAGALQAFARFCAWTSGWIRQPQSAAILQSALIAASSSMAAYRVGGLADAISLYNAFAACGAPDEALQMLGQAISLLRRCVVGFSCGADYQAALGISLFCPGNSATYVMNRQDYEQLGFARATGWLSVLDVIYGQERNMTSTDVRATSWNGAR